MDYSSGNPPAEQPLFDVVQPHHHDVLSGRGVTTNRHEGNTKFRSLVALNKVRAPVSGSKMPDSPSPPRCERVFVTVCTWYRDRREFSMNE